MPVLKKLIVTADDVGLHRGMTEGALRAHREGIVTACSMVAIGREFDDAVARLRDTPTIAIGIHLTLVEEQSLTGIHLPRNWRRFVAGMMPAMFVEHELRAQVDKVLATGLRITHLNSHQHLHMLPRVFRIVREIAEERAIPYVRIVDDRGGRAGVARRLAVRALSALGRRARSSKTNDHTIGVLEAGHLRDVTRLLDHVKGVTELVTHPGAAVDAYPHWKYDWEGELRALTAPGLREELGRRGIELTTPRS